MRRVHKVHDVLVAPSRGLAGVGVYVLGEAGHARAFPIPEVVISDDEWVERSFAPNERVVVASASSVVRPATNVRHTCVDGCGCGAVTASSTPSERALATNASHWLRCTARSRITTRLPWPLLAIWVS